MPRGPIFAQNWKCYADVAYCGIPVGLGGNFVSENDSWNTN